MRKILSFVRQCNKVVSYTTGATVFNKEQELTIGLKSMKEFVMKVKAGLKMKKDKFAYFN